MKHGWQSKVFHNSVTQSGHLRQLDLSINSSTVIYNLRSDEIETNVGPNGDDVCDGDPGEANAADFVFISKHFSMVRRASVYAER